MNGNVFIQIFRIFHWNWIIDVIDEIYYKICGFCCRAMQIFIENWIDS